MAVKASYSITIASINDVTSTSRYYLLQSSTLAAPSKPTASPPGGSWQTTEPTYTEGSTNSLYFTDETIFSDSTFAYSEVSLSTSYEAAKAAYNKAVAANKLATAINNYFSADSAGAHVGTVEGNPNSGLNLLLAAAKIALRSAATELATFAADLIELGKNSSTAIIKFCAGNGEIGSVKSQLHLSGTKGAYLARQTDIDNGNDFGVGLVDDSGSAKAIIEAAKFQVAGQSLTSAQMATALVPKVLYSGSTTGTVTLSETAASFSKLIIYGKYDTFYTSTTVYSPNGKSGCLEFFIPNAGPATMVYIKSRTFGINGTQITNGAWTAMWLNASTNHFDSVSAPEISIVRVEGIR